MEIFSIKFLVIMYKAPLNDLNFVINQIIDLHEINNLPGYAEISNDLISQVLEEAGKVSNILAESNYEGDHVSSKRNEDGSVTTPPGFKESYKALGEGGWTSLEAKEEFGGQQMPTIVSAAVNEIWHSANMSLALCHLLTQGLIYALQKSASKAQQDLFIPPLVEGRWTGTMNLTEPQAGTDLASIKSKAVKEGDHYRISGQKIYITYGEHDMSENIIHLVLARTPDAPDGVKGISVFIVPKYNVSEDGKLEEQNDVTCLSIEKKLGVKGSPTAVLQFGEKNGAIGYLVGEENQGLQIMFEMMNHARFAVGIQGLSISERAFQQAVQYANDRVQGIPIKKNKGDPIIHHPDVLRMLSVMKSEIEAMRALSIYGGFSMDMANLTAVDKEFWQERSSLLVPIIKGWLTERSLEITSQAIQVHGGMGFIEETGVAQHFRDARILPIYEGTTAIQANDLVFRKTIRDQGKSVNCLFEEIIKELEGYKNNENKIVSKSATTMMEAVSISKESVDHLIASSNDQKKSAVSGVNYLMLMGYLCGGWMMSRSASKAAQEIVNKNKSNDFLEAKLVSSDIFMTHLLPKIKSLAESIIKGDESILAMKPEWLSQ